LRTALAALDNAEAVQPAEGFRAEASEHFAGGVTGLGAAEVERRMLDADSQRAIVKAEIEARLSSARTYEQHGQNARGAELRVVARCTWLDRLALWAYLTQVYPSDAKSGGWHEQGSSHASPTPGDAVSATVTFGRLRNA
jgi:hypothetical protein